MGMALHSSDEETLASLMKAALAGNDGAYAEFLRLAAVLVRGFARRRISENAVVSPEDIVQETLLAIHQKRHTWRNHEPILPWVFSITRHKVIDVYRRNGVRVFVDVDDFVDSLAAPDQPPPTPDEGQVEEALIALTEGQRNVVRSIAVEGRSISETATTLEMKETAVRVAFHRGLAAIAAKFGRQT